jgi:hypothetical protein
MRAQYTVFVLAFRITAWKNSVSRISVNNNAGGLRRTMHSTQTNRSQLVGLAMQTIKNIAGKVVNDQMFVDIISLSSLEGAEDQIFHIKETISAINKEGKMPIIRIILSHQNLIGIEAMRQMKDQSDLKAARTILLQFAQNKHKEQLQFQKLIDDATIGNINANIDIRLTRTPYIPFEFINISGEIIDESPIMTTIIAIQHINIPINRCAAFIADEDTSIQSQSDFDLIWGSADILDIGKLPSIDEIAEKAIKEIIG